MALATILDSADLESTRMIRSDLVSETSGESLEVDSRE